MKNIKSSFVEFEQLITDEKITIEKRLDEVIAKNIQEYLLNIVNDIGSCESPIEKIFAIEFRRVLQDSDLNYNLHYIDFSPQQELILFEGYPREVKYRPDFLVHYHNHKTGADYKFAIECDGHDFHEKTKEQASKDKLKDRNLMLNGITPIRFTGSDIYEDPFKCAMDALKIIENYIFNIYRLN